MNLTKENLHHAYIIEGNKDDVYPKICEFCEKDLNFNTKANPDFVYEEYDKLLTREAKQLKDKQFNKTTDRGRKIFIISFNFITREAQNSLLKVLEEPTDGTHFFFITPTSKLFLDTVLSRVQVISLRSKDDISDGPKFLKKSFDQRLKDVTKLVKDIKDEKVSKVEAIKLSQEVLIDLYSEAKGDAKKLKKVKEVEKVVDYLHDNGASTKNLLEYLAIIS